VHMQSKVLSPAAEALRYFIIEHGETYLAAHDRPWLEPAAGW
jgi:LysR family transcriptional regulator, low CO2-responsive transcriptional regulator